MSVSKLLSMSGSLVLLALCGGVSFYWGYLTNRDQIFPYNYVAETIEQKKQGAAADKAWAQKVIDGGYILHVRHGQRERWVDVTAFDAYELATGVKAENSSFRRAVCLTEQGKEEAKLIGAIFDRVGVEVGTVISSPSCRARQTAMSAFGRIDTISNALIHRTALMKEQRGDFARELRKLLEEADVESGKNVVLSGHAKTLKYNMGEVIDVDQTNGVDDRLQTGIAVLEKDGDRIIARHTFASIREFAHAVLEVPVETTMQAPFSVSSR